jgi:hypothetical protein
MTGFRFDNQIAWPEACVGCGTTEGLTPKTLSYHDSHRSKELQGLGIGPVKTYKVTTYTTKVTMQLALCQDCRQKALAEQKVHYRANSYAMYLTLFLTFVMGLLAIQMLAGSIHFSATTTMFFLGVMVTTLWVPFYFNTKADVYDKRRDAESYFNIEISAQSNRVDLGFRNEEYYKKLATVNPIVAATIKFNPRIRMNSKESSSKCLVWCFGIIFLGMAVIGALTREGMVNWYLYFVLPAVVVLITGILIRFVLLRISSKGEEVYEGIYE